MKVLPSALRRQVERTVIDARRIAETGAAAALHALAVYDGEAFPHMDLAESWIVETAPTAHADRPARAEELNRGPDQEADARSLLWDESAPRPLPQGNYPVLDALALGYLCRDPADADGLLRVLERHANRHEDTAVWVALAGYMVHLDRADPRRATAFAVALIEKHPDMLRDAWTVPFVLSMLNWMQPEMINSILDGWASGSWELGPQAAGEVAMVVLSRNQDERDARERIERYLSRKHYGCTTHQQLATGVAHTLVEAMRHAEFRPFATPYLVRVIALADDRLARELHRMFWDDRVMRPDEYTELVFGACLKHPRVPRGQRDSMVVERLQALLALTWNPCMVSRVAAAYLDIREQLSAQDALGHGHSDDQLVEVALTLHRLPETRVKGLELFERLMVLSAHGVPPKLATLDRHAA